ncbi:sensor histidine kinase [Amycolatopsis nigrescens]|uniref:sensor histidine kinase n=1 Tax=Amycolatopsis nigrescens TaxID=381445 RepID=UPI0003801129|nr:HAMP domain-containing sensor histidine kinase [Amycolatopsis nigrescens]
MRRSLRARILLSTVSLLAAGVMISDAVVLTTLRRPLVEQVDLQLQAGATALSLLPEPVFRQLAGLRPEGTVQEPDLVEDLYLGYLAPDGRPERELRPESMPALPKLDSAAVAERAGQPFEVPGWRVLALPRAVSDMSDMPGSVVVAGSTSRVDATVAEVATVCVLVGLGVLALLTVLGWFAVRAGLRPLRRIEETSAAIAAGDLSRRVPDLAPPGTEVGRLAVALNGMLGQIEQAVAARAASETRMRRFVADASHELRTPLAGISGFAELHRMGAGSDSIEVDRTMDRIEREAQRLAGLVDDLLLLAQLDERPVPRLEPMDLRTLAADALHDARALDATREVTLTGPGGGEPGPAPVTGDESRLRQVVANLVGNAIAHTPAGGPIRIGVGAVGDRAVLEISDHGPGLDADQAAKVFERFYRADTSRSRDTGGAGLGLAIAHSLTVAHDGTLELDTAPGAGATFRLSLPRA